MVEKLADGKLLGDEGLEELVVEMEVFFSVVLENEFYFVE